MTFVNASIQAPALRIAASALPSMNVQFEAMGARAAIEGPPPR